MTTSTKAPSRWARIPLVGNVGYPLALKELRAMIRRGRYFWAQFLYMAVLAVGVVILIVAQLGNSSDPERVANLVFGGFFLMQTALVYLVFPAFAATCISGERMEKSFDLVLTTDLTPAEIVWGKFIGVFGSCCYFLIVTLPILTVTVLFGGKSVGEAIEGYCYLFLQAALITIFGVFVSAASPSNIRSILATYAMAFIVGGVSLSLFASNFEAFNTVSLMSLLSQRPIEEQLIAWVATTLCFGAAFGLCFLGAVQRLTPPEANRGMPIRIFVLFLITTSVILSQHLAMYWAGDFTTRVQDRLGWLLIVGAPTMVLATLCAFFFSGGPVNTPLRVARGFQRQPLLHRLLWIFLQGGVRGFVYSSVIFAIAAYGVWYLADVLRVFPLTASDLRSNAWIPGDVLGDVVKMLLSGISAAVFAFAALSFMLAALEITGVLNLAIVLGCAVLANCYSATFVAMQLPPEWFHGYPLSIFVGFLDYFERDLKIGTGIEAAIIAHIIAGVLFLAIGAWRCRAQKLSVIGLSHPSLGKERARWAN